MEEMRIKLLSEELINKIAAGEVVERPASVVKELAENSLDAGASQIAVEIQEAGKKLIRVSDNGSGMSPTEIELALQRHSTSKLSTLEDLFNIRTLGFRGEALPAIASVSKMKIESNPAGKGITVEVKDLFCNTPARKKFLKSNPTELGHSGEIISKYALAFPGTAFKLISDGKTLLSSPGNGKLLDAIMAVYGMAVVKELIEVDFPFAAGRVSGYISRPLLSRIDKSYENFYVNRRWIRSFLLNRALEEAYRALIPGNRFPVGIIFIELDPQRVDVNVHPTKREVKFLNNQEIMEAVTAAALKALSGFKENQNIRLSEGEYQSSRISGREEWRPEMMDAFFSVTSNQQPVISGGIELEATAVLPLFPIYQHQNTYIIATDGEELVLIDQHAAHERVLYDQLSHQSTVTSHQSLLIPETIEFSAEEVIILQENIEYLRALGFDLEEFGDNSYILRSVPAVAINLPAKQLLLDLVMELKDLGRSAQLEVKRENLRKMIACHSAIKAGDKLTPAEMNQLIKNLYATENPLTCPHGRPTMVRIGREELAKRFGR
jgi:DNA mismatch repair protein MutL